MKHCVTCLICDYMKVFVLLKKEEELLIYNNIDYCFLGNKIYEFCLFRD